MDQESLLRDTNALLKQLLELEEDRKREGAEALEAMKAKFPTAAPELPEMPSPASSDILSGHREQMDAIRRQDDEYKQAVLDEYREQTRLLTEILERIKS